VNRLQRHAPLDPTPVPEPPIGDRSGPVLGQGFVLTMISTIAAEHASPETLKVIERVEPYAWYHGQLLESVLNEFEDRDPALPLEIGKNLYYMLRPQFVELGIITPADVVQQIPLMWNQVTRGDSGEWRSTMFNDHHARMEMEQPFNCHFEEGAVHGALEAADATDVRVEHTQCMRDGAPFCVLDVQWQGA
jgi:hypothetical protein